MSARADKFEIQRFTALSGEPADIDERRAERQLSGGEPMSAVGAFRHQHLPSVATGVCRGGQQAYASDIWQPFSNARPQLACLAS